MQQQSYTYSSFDALMLTSGLKTAGQAEDGQMTRIAARLTERFGAPAMRCLRQAP
jgi:hypothetical protein